MPDQRIIIPFIRFSDEVLLLAFAGSLALEIVVGTADHGPKLVNSSFERDWMSVSSVKRSVSMAAWCT